MIPAILGITLPSYITEDRPLVNKLTLLQANNESFRETASRQRGKNGTATGRVGCTEMEGCTDI